MEKYCFLFKNLFEGRGEYGCDLDLYKVNPDLSMTKFVKIKPPSNATGIHHLSFDPFTKLFMVDLKELSQIENYKNQLEPDMYII